MDRPNEILLRLWMAFKVADRTGQRRSKAFARALETLTSVSFEGRGAAFRITTAAERKYGYDPLADAVWIHRSAIGLLTGYAVAAPEKNFFAPEKPLIQKLSEYIRANEDVDLATTFMRKFAEDKEDLTALLHAFNRTPESTPWIGVPSIGWGVPEDVFWIGISGGEKPWPTDPEERDIHSFRLRHSQPYPLNELWPDDERARAVQLQRLIRPLPPAPRSSWRSETLLGPQEWKVWHTPRFFWQSFLPGLAATHGAELIEHVSEECIYAEACSFDSLKGRFAFWFPELSQLQKQTIRGHYYRESFREARRALAKRRYAPDWYVMATPWLYDFIYTDLYPLARGRSLPAPLLIIDQPLTHDYIDMLPWLFFLHDTINPRDEEDFPSVRAESDVERDAQALVYIMAWVLEVASKRPSDPALLRAVVEEVVPGQFDTALNALLEAKLLKQQRDGLGHHNVPFPGIADLGRVLRWLGYDAIVDRLLTSAQQYGLEPRVSDKLQEFQQSGRRLRDWAWL